MNIPWIFSLPTDILSGKVLKFLDLKSFVVLDSAVYNRSKRDTLLLCQQSVTLALLQVQSQNGCYISTLNWLRIRGICNDSITVGVKGLSLSQLELHKHMLRQLKKIKVSDQSQEADVDQIIENIPTKSIEELYISNAKFPETSLIKLIKSMPNIQTLCVENATTATDQVLDALAENCPLLRMIEIVKCPNIVFCDSSVKNFCSKCPKLTHIRIPQCDTLSSSAIHTIATSCNNLSKFEIPLSSHLDDESLLAIARCNNLKCLDITHYESVTPSGLVTFAMHCNSLEEIKLGLLLQVHDISYAHFFEHCKNLTSFSGILHVNIVLAVLPHWCNMTSLTLDSPSLTDGAVLAIAKVCTQLKSLDVNNRYITDASLFSLSTYAPQLEMLSLVNCRMIKNIGVVRIVQGCVSLRELRLDGSAYLNDECFEAIVEYAHNLQLLHFKRCPRVVLEKTQTLKTRCMRLYDLRLWEDTTVDLLW